METISAEIELVFALLKFFIMLSYFAFLIFVFISVIGVLSFGWRGYMYLATGYTIVPFYPFIIVDDPINAKCWLGFRDNDGNSQLHLAIMAHDERRMRWLSFSEHLRNVKNNKGQLPADLANELQDEQLKARIQNQIDEQNGSINKLKWIGAPLGAQQTLSLKLIIMSAFFWKSALAMLLTICLAWLGGVKLWSILFN
jgi:hypothetical protein